MRHSVEYAGLPVIYHRWMRMIETKGMRVDVDALSFVKSTRSGPYSDNCVEVALFPGGAAVRDSKDPGGPVLLFTDPEWSAFGEGFHAGEFDK